VFNPNAVVFHLRHPDTLRRYLRQKFWRGYWRMVVYRRFPEKMVKDTYTPQSLKIQVLTLFGAAFFLLVGVAFRPALGLAALLLGAFVLSTVPFALAAVKRDATVAALSPPLLALRAATIGCGIVYFGLFGHRRVRGMAAGRG
jgi:hypothetical protein